MTSLIGNVDLPDMSSPVTYIAKQTVMNLLEVQQIEFAFYGLCRQFTGPQERKAGLCLVEPSLILDA